MYQMNKCQIKSRMNTMVNDVINSKNVRTERNGASVVQVLGFLEGKSWWRGTKPPG
jgi:uncharacterized protein YkuJ